MTRRTSVALLALLLVLVGWSGALTAAKSAIGAKVKRSARPPRNGAGVRSRIRRPARGAKPRAFASSSCAYTHTLPSRRNVVAIDAAVVCLIDRERLHHQLGPPRTNRDLETIATKQANDMVLGGYFGDNSPSGQTALARVRASPYGSHSSGLSLGQNIGWGTDGFATPAAIVASWMRSPAHRQIILTTRYRDVGAGVAPAPPRRTGTRGATYVLELAARAR